MIRVDYRAPIDEYLWISSFYRDDRERDELRACRVHRWLFLSKESIFLNFWLILSIFQHKTAQNWVFCASLGAINQSRVAPPFPFTLISPLTHTRHWEDQPKDAPFPTTSSGHYLCPSLPLSLVVQEGKSVSNGNTVNCLATRKKGIKEEQNGAKYRSMVLHRTLSLTYHGNGMKVAKWISKLTTRPSHVEIAAIVVFEIDLKSRNRLIDNPTVPVVTSPRAETKREFGWVQSSSDHSDIFAPMKTIDRFFQWKIVYSTINLKITVGILLYQLISWEVQ